MNIDDSLRGVMRLFLDTAPLIYYVEENRRYLPLVDVIFDRIFEEQLIGITSPISLAECLARPYRLGQTQLQQIQIGARIYQDVDAEVIKKIVRSLLQELQSPVPTVSTLVKSVDELVEKVRSRFHNDIQRLHGTMPLLGVDHWVDLGELFVDS